MPCRVVWRSSLNDIRGFPDAAFIRNWRNHLPNSSLCIRCKTGRQIGRGTRWRHHGSHCGVLRRAHRGADGCRYQTHNCLVLSSRHGVFSGLLPKPRSRCWRGSMNCGCASICRWRFCLFRAILSARAHRPWSGTSGPRTLAAELAAAAGGADFIRTRAAPLALVRAGGIRRR